MSTISETAQKLVEIIRELDAVAVAFSGGVDSAVVARAAKEALGDRAIAVTAVSPSLASAELEDARRTAAAIGIRHAEIPTSEFQRSEYRANAGDRCYFCKDTLYTLTESMLSELGVTCMVNGANTDDRGDHRPGMQAALEHCVRSPLIDAGLDKATVRRLAHHWQLEVADKPASPCLSSRVAYGVEVTEERVRRVEQAEAFLRQLLNVAELRVRLEFGELARIELPLSRIAEAASAETAVQICDRLRSLGFRQITLDLQGFRTGNLNDHLSLVQLRSDVAR
ncbi:MAG: ATP-dependent sacrificial sulfur transferase LarE [Planctomycetaceae bacterium]|nr:ATP-dependent sacrificial sulfur transferase LarE [Planctomycetaceae bacterium]